MILQDWSVDWVASHAGTQQLHAVDGLISLHGAFRLRQVGILGL